MTGMQACRRKPSRVSCSSSHVPHACASCQDATTAPSFFCCKAESSRCAEMGAACSSSQAVLYRKRAQCFNAAGADHLQRQGGSTLRYDAGHPTGWHLQRFGSGFRVQGVSCRDDSASRREPGSGQAPDPQQERQGPASAEPLPPAPDAEGSSAEDVLDPTRDRPEGLDEVWWQRLLQVSQWCLHRCLMAECHVQAMAQPAACWRLSLNSTSVTYCTSCVQLELTQTTIKL